MLSKTCKYGIQSLILLASIKKGADSQIDEYVLGKQLSSALSIPKEYIHKVLHILVNKKLVTSMKGPQGGFRLARAPADITLFDIVKAIDGTAAFETCVIRAQKCDEHNPCGLHHYWRKNLIQARTLLDQITIDQLADEVRKGNHVLELCTEDFGLHELKKQIGIN